MSELNTRRGLPGLAFPEEALKRSAADLVSRFAGTFSAETIERCVLESYTALLRTSRVQAHLAMHATRFAAERLTALGQATGTIERAVPEVLFVCEQNAGRSQMAAVFTYALSGGNVHVRSAGSAPARDLHPVVGQAMQELGLDLSEAFPKPLTDDVVQAADIVITMGCGDACPVYPGKTYQDWHLTDPADLPIEQVRLVRDDVRKHVEALLRTLGIESKGLPA
jgi:arsenate reductase